jgi:hypothetical protein
VLGSDPLLLAKTFTLREFGRLANQPPELLAVAGTPSTDELQSRVALIARRRGHGDAVGAANDDIADPYGGSIKAARTAAADIAAAVAAIADGLGLAPIVGQPEAGDLSAVPVADPRHRAGLRRRPGRGPVAG